MSNFGVSSTKKDINLMEGHCGFERMRASDIQGEAQRAGDCSASRGECLGGFYHCV